MMIIPEWATPEAIITGLVFIAGGIGVVWRRITVIKKAVTSLIHKGEDRADEIENNVAGQAEIIDELSRQVGELSREVVSMQAAMASKDKTIARLTSEVESLRVEVAVLRDRDKRSTEEIARLTAIASHVDSEQ